MSISVAISDTARPTAKIETEALQALADIRAVEVDDLKAEVATPGSDGALLSSHEVVAILVVLQPLTGIDPRKPDVLKACDAQTLSQFLRFIERRVRKT